MTQDPQRSGWFSKEPTQEQPTSAQPVEPSQPSQPAAPSQPTAPPGYGPPPSPVVQPSGYPPPTGYGGYAGTPPAPPVGYGYGYAGAPGSPAGPFPPAAPAPTSAIVLLVVSGLLALVLSWTLVGLAYAAPAILGIVAMTRARTDAHGAKRLTRTGWIIFGIITALGVAAVIALIAFLVAVDGGSGGYDGSSI